MSFAPLSSVTLLYLAKENPAKGGSAHSAFLAADELTKAAKALYDAGYHLEDVSGLDTAEGFVAVYHFDHFTSPGRVTLRVLAPHDAPVFPSIAPIFQGAEWHERETADFYGFDFPGNPNLVPLLLPDDMAEVNPLRKDEAARAPLHVLLKVAEREVLFQAEGFTLMDAPAVEAPPAEAPAEAPAQAPAEAAPPAVKAESAPVVKKEAPVAVKTEASLAVKAEAPLAVKPEAPLTKTEQPETPEKTEAPKEAEKSAPEKKAPAKADKKAEAPVKKPAKAAAKKGDASDA